MMQRDYAFVVFKNCVPNFEFAYLTKREYFPTVCFWGHDVLLLCLLNVEIFCRFRE